MFVFICPWVLKLNLASTIQYCITVAYYAIRFVN